MCWLVLAVLLIVVTVQVSDTTMMSKEMMLVSKVTTFRN